MAALSQPCDTSLPASKHSGKRDPKSIRWVVLHSTEGGTASSVAHMFHTAHAQASTHIVVDNYDCFRMLNDNQIPWGAPGANTAGWHVEQCGFARWSRQDWLERARPTIRRAAYKAAIRCVAYNIPARFVGPIGLRLGRKGITFHSDVTKAWPKRGTHWDPGPGYPKDVFLADLKRYIKELEEGGK